MTENNTIQETMEPSWYVDYKDQQFAQAEKSVNPEFRYGLSILIQPPKDFCVDPAGATSAVRRVVDAPGCEVSEQISDACKVFYEKQWAPQTHAWYHMHEATANDILHIIIPKGSVIEKPIRITDEFSEKTYSSILIHAQASCACKIIYTKSGKGGLLSEHVKILAEENSSVEFTGIQHLDNDTSLIQHRSSIMGKNAKVTFKDLSLGALYLKSDTISNLSEEGAEGKITVLFAGAKKQRYDIYTGSIHQNKHTYSDIVTKGVLNGDAKGLSRGLVRIEEPASGSNGYEQQDCLLLSESAEADAIPNLEIHNHDVKCSHGSTVGQVDESALFYLQSRGLTEQQAKQKIVEGYFTPVLDALDNKEEIRDILISNLGDSHAN